MTANNRTARRSPTRGPTPQLAYLLASVALALAGCANPNGSSKTLARDGFGISFEYPGNLRLVDRVSFAASTGPTEGTIGLVLDRHNGITVTRAKRNLEVSHSNLDSVRQEIDEDVSFVADPRPRGQATTVAGLPALRYPPFRLLSAIEGPDDATNRVTVVFDRQIQYALNCHSTPARRAEINAACDVALDTIKRRQHA